MEEKKKRKRQFRYQGAIKPPEHPSSIEHVKKCAYAIRLRYLYNRPWQAIAETLWPRDEETDQPLPGAQPMWGGHAGACQAVMRFQREHLAEIKGNFVDQVCTHIAMRQAALAVMVEGGDLLAIAQHRAEDELLLKIFGGFAPTKLAPTSPDGSNPYTGVLVVAQNMNPDEWAKTAIDYQTKLMALNGPVIDAASERVGPR